MISVVIPLYNEEDNVAVLENELLKVLSGIEHEIIFVDDGSTDGSREILLSLADESTRIVLHDRNQGKGAALRSGFRYVTGEIVIIQDADLEYEPAQYPKLIKPILDGKADVVYGSRFVTGDYRRVLLFWHTVGNKLLTLLSNLFTNLNLTDMETCYKVFRRDVLEKFTIEEDRFGFEPEITAKVAKLKLRIYEMGISYSGRTYSEGKKVGWKDGISAVRCIIKYNLLR